MAQSVKCPTSGQVMISQFLSSSPTLGSVLTAQSLDPTSDSGSPSLSPSPAHAPSLSLSKINNINKRKDDVRYLGTYLERDMREVSEMLLRFSF